MGGVELELAATQRCKFQLITLAAAALALATAGRAVAVASARSIADAAAQPATAITLAAASAAALAAAAYPALSTILCTAILALVGHKGLMQCLTAGPELPNGHRLGNCEAFWVRLHADGRVSPLYATFARAPPY